MAAALDNHFYHNSIRTYTAAFGTIFNNIKVVRSSTGQVIKVPLSYSSRQKFDIQQKYEGSDAHYQVKFPRIGFLLTGWQRDTERLQNKHNSIYQNIDRTESDSVNKQLNRVPYIFNYQVTVGTKNLDDMFQIMEQIAAWFNPSLNIQISENPDLGIETSINVKMTGSNLTDDFEGAMEDEKTLISTFDFEVEGFLYMPSGNQGVIQTVCVNYYDLDTGIEYESESGCYPPPEPPECCVEWSELGEDQYAIKEVDVDGIIQLKRLINFNDPIIKPKGFSNELVNISGNIYAIKYYYYSSAVGHFSLFYTNEYPQLDKYFDSMCLYYKIYDPFDTEANTEVKFSLVAYYDGIGDEIITESEVISMQGSEDIIRKVSLDIPEEYQYAPIAIKFEKNYATLELHDARICSNGELVPWKQPTEPS